MEITVDILNEASKINALRHKKLSNYYADWDTYSISDIINGKTGNHNSNEIWSTIQIIKQRLEYPQHRQGAIQELSEIISFINVTIQEAFGKSDIRKLLIFLSTYALLNNPSNFYHEVTEVPIHYFIELNKIDKTEISPLIEKSFAIIQTFYIQLSIASDAPYHEKEAFDKYQEGIKELDIEKTYNVIRAIEDGRGIITSYLIENLFRFLYSLDPKKFTDYLKLKSEPHVFIASLQWMGKSELIKLADFPHNNVWLLFEILRQLSDSNDKRFYRKEVEAGSIILDQIHSVSSDVYFQVLNYFKSDETINKSIGRQLSSVDDNLLKDVIEKCFNLDVYSFNSKAKQRLLEEFSQKVSGDKLVFFLESVYDKWLNFLNYLENDSKEFHAIDLVLTDYFDFVVAYMIKKNHSEPINLKVETLIQQISKINEQWFRSESIRNNQFFILLSKLYILSVAVRELATSGTIINVDSWDDLYTNQIIKSVFFRRNEDILETMNNNFKKTGSENV